MSELRVDDATRQLLLSAWKGRHRVRLLDGQGEIFGEFVKITKVDGEYVEGDWPDGREGTPADHARRNLHFTPEQVMTMLRRIREELAKGPPPSDEPPADTPHVVGPGAG